MFDDIYYESEISKKIIEEHNIIIYGARIVAKEVANCLIGAPYHCNVEAFMVSTMEGNPEEVLGCPVITMEEGYEIYRDNLIIVAVLEKYLDEIKKTLEQSGFNNVIFCGFESDLWSGLRGNYFRLLCLQKYGKYLALEENINAGIIDKKSVSIYTAKCHVDRDLASDRYYAWEKIIQVGADLTDIKICEIQDNTGENISSKNKKYCELTALYWIWKNDKSDYAGLGHYRRHFDLSEDQIEMIGRSDIDVILTIPILNFPNVRAVYENDHIIDDWNTMLEVIKELSPDYYDAAIELQNGIYYYAYNMIIARKDILDEYCEWLFPILEECEKRCKPRDDKYQARYIGFLAERLLSVFFLHNWDRWKIVHAKKNFLS